MTGDSGLLIGDERVGDPRTRTTRVYGGRIAKVIRRHDDRIGVVDATNNEPLGLLISEHDADLLEQAKAELAPAVEDDGLGPLRGIGLAAVVGLALIVLGYGLFHAGRWFERQYGAGIHESRFSVR